MHSSDDLRSATDRIAFALTVVTCVLLLGVIVMFPEPAVPMQNEPPITAPSAEEPYYLPSQFPAPQGEPAEPIATF